MKKINSRQYRLWVKFCRNLFRKEKFISQRKLNLLIQQNINPCSTRYRRYFVDLQLLTEKNKMMYPGMMLYHFKQQDFYMMNRLMKIGMVKIIDKEIHFSNIQILEIEIPEHWEIIKQTKTKLIFKPRLNVQNI